MRTTFRRLLVAFAGLAVLGLATAACGDDSSGSSSTSGAETVTVTGAWARTSAAMQSAGAAYMDLNGGKSADKLTGVTVPADVAKTAELHETTMAHSSGMTAMSGSGASGMMEMKPVAAIEVPAGKKVSLAPGGYHVMLLDLAKPLTTGQKFTLTLTFEKAGKVEVPVEVRAS